MSSRAPLWRPRAIPALGVARSAGVATTVLLALAVAVGPATTTDTGAAPGGAAASAVVRLAVMDAADPAMADPAVRDSARQRAVGLDGGRDRGGWPRRPASVRPCR
jgi:hypothetical protein